ncbi:hypothetical protein FBQ84_04755 [Ignavibacteria bacterium CHB1]|nr:Thermophilic serine proteinase [Ignavibacteria bacterium]MCC6885784.1 S8 family serine peptidase [Ignavibacteriales bacterium]MCE7953021.1 hypothetical protein [Chlorobi bacterium CHB7]MDL1887141.1 hypothetical protein [Ignavibacteria bacterium CHB1]RIK49842.1 MAG: hypothetical protein DCC60_02145 [Ignavibacteriota bacterium]
MRKLIFIFLICASVSLPVNEMAGSDKRLTNFSTVSFFIKTNKPLKVSEATGEILLNTGIASLDEKFSEFNVKSIKLVFGIFNGDRDLYSKLEMDRIYVVTIDGGSVNRIEDAISEIGTEDIIEFAEPNYIGIAAGVKGTDYVTAFSLQEKIPNDRYFHKQWYLNNDGSIQSSSSTISIPGADINMLNAWEIEKGSEQVIVAILDSGIRDDHPELRNRIWINEGEIPNNGIDDDRNGYTDDHKGWDFAYDSKNNYDGFGHGTNIASVIGAETNNLIGFAGIDQNAQLMNCKNLSDDNYGEYIWWSRSIKYAVDNGANVINMSEGGEDYSRVLKTAIDYANSKGVLVLSAMMNKGDGKDYYPASFEGVLAVGATDTDDNRCLRFTWGGGSCYGDHIGVVAPGNKIYGLDYEDINNYDVYWSGTSQSTAIVSAIASLLISQDNSRSRLDLIDIITNTARDQVGDPREDKPGWDRFYGHGRVDAYLALLFQTDPLLVSKLKNEPLKSSSDLNNKPKNKIYEPNNARAKDSKSDSSKINRTNKRSNRPNPAKR